MEQSNYTYLEFWN